MHLGLNALGADDESPASFRKGWALGASGAATELRQRDVSDPAFAVGLLSIFALGCVARFYGLSKRPIWMDEAFSYFVSTRPLNDILFNKIDNHPPFFMPSSIFGCSSTKISQRSACRLQRSAASRC